MKIAITGASGLIGRALAPALQDDGHTVVRMVRRPARGADEVAWDPGSRTLEPAALAGVDAVVHLAGAGIGARRWTAGYQRTLLDSRVGGTTTLASAITACAGEAPRIWLSASAVGYYGDTGDRIVDEASPAGTGFLAHLCEAWEEATGPAAEAGVRVCLLGSGLVLSPKGGLLGRTRPMFKLGLGGRLGSGRQYQSWISLHDEIAAIRYLLAADDIAGPVNLTGPEPVTNAEFTRTLGRLLGRPTVAAVPGFALRAALGAFADEGVLTGQRVAPRVLTDHGFTHTHPDLESALRWALSP
jgi:uncharacterized protein